MIPFRKKCYGSRQKKVRNLSSKTVNRFGLLKRTPVFVPKRYRLGILTELACTNELLNGAVSELRNCSETVKIGGFTPIFLGIFREK